MNIDQFLFGYKKGHQLLSGSAKLDPDNIDILTRLSDLSGSMTLNTDFFSYLTCFPLPDQSNYVVSKTWLDKHAQRSGCVLTHTLLIPSQIWMNFNNIEIFKNLLCEPQDSSDLEKYKEKISINYKQEKFSNTNIEDKNETNLVREFVFKFFGEGINPVVLFTESNIEDYCWRFLNTFWPSLRMSFSFCTFCLQPRYLDKDAFNLMVAPNVAFSRFTKIPQANIVEKSSLSYSIAKENNPEELWLIDWTNYLLNPSAKNSISNHFIKKELVELGNYLGKDPQSIRKLYLIKELQNRSTFSPMASIGLLDIVESIAQDEDLAIQYKEKLLIFSFDAIRNSNDTIESSKCLYLISERLNKDAYKGINNKILNSYYLLISIIVEKDSLTVWKLVDSLFYSSQGFIFSPFFLGFAKGLVSIGEKEPGRLTILQERPDLSSILISIEPLIGKYYLRIDENKQQRIDDLTNWIQRINDKEELASIRMDLLQEVSDDNFKYLAEALLRYVSQNDIPWILDSLYTSTNHFNFREINKTIIDLLASPFPSQTEDWAIKKNVWHSEIVDIVVSIYPRNIEGLLKILESNKFTKIQKSCLLGPFINKCTHNGLLPNWILEISKNDSRIISTLFLLNEPKSEENIIAINNIFSQVSILPVVRVFSAEEYFTYLSEIGFPYSKSFMLASQKSAIAEYLLGKIDWETFLSWFPENIIIDESDDLSSKEIATILRDHCPLNESSWKRGWKLLSYISEKTPNKNLILLLESLISINGFDWDIEIAKYWLSVLINLRMKSSKDQYLNLCIETLYFAFRHTNYPLSELVVESFLPVYSIVIDGTPLPTEIYKLFSYFDWDKAKELRKKIIEVYINSNWPPGDLGLAVGDQLLLRKIYSRLIRYSGGKDYCYKIIFDLAQRKDNQSATKVSDQLRSFVNQPNFYEHWD